MTGSLRTAHPDRFDHVPGFLDDEAQHELLRFLEAVPVVDPADHDVTRRFTFTSPRAGNVVVRDRREAAAGWPVWVDGRPQQGVAVPAPLAELAAVVGACLAPAGGGPISFTSVYVDRYGPGGRFFPHTDRSCYGPIVAGVSVGPGSSTITFRTGDRVDLEQVLEPGSLYAFSGTLRQEPCTHEVGHVSGLRYGVTFRTPASDLAGVDR